MTSERFEAKNSFPWGLVRSRRTPGNLLPPLNVSVISGSMLPLIRPHRDTVLLSRDRWFSKKNILSKVLLIRRRNFRIDCKVRLNYRRNK